LKKHIWLRTLQVWFSLKKERKCKSSSAVTKVLIPVLDSKTEEQISAVADLIKQEVNVKELQLINAEEASHLIVKQIKPNFKALGPKLGKDMKVVGGEIANLDRTDFNIGKRRKIDVQGYEITLDDVEISTKDIPGWTVTSDGKTTVALDLTLTDELKSEGIAREFINRVQNLRKEKDLNLQTELIFH
jgi:isoleucyl-tRNA synthetase